MNQTYHVKLSMNQSVTVLTGIVFKKGDFGFDIAIEIMDFDNTDTTPQIVFRKPSGAVESTDITVVDNIYTYTVKGTELDTPGVGICDIKLKNSTTQRISTASFQYHVIADTLDGLNEQASSYSDTIDQIVDDCKNQIADVKKVAENINCLTGTPISGGYISYNSGNYGANVDWSYYPMFRIDPNTYYMASYHGAHVAFFNENKEYISGVLVNNNANNFDFKSPATAAFMTYSFLTSSGNQYVIRSKGYSRAYIEPEYKQLGITTDVPLYCLTSVIKTGKNLFNKFNLIEGYAIDYSDASRIWKNASYCYCPEYIPVKANTEYYKNRACIIGEYDVDLQCVATRNLTSIAAGSFTTTASTKYILVGTPIAQAPYLQLEEGSAATEYQPFTVELKNNTAAKIRTVKTDETAQYKSISSAIADSSDDDIIIVYPGEYVESIKAYQKRVNIIGTDRKGCILKYSGLDYDNPPLEIARGSVKNLTIKATNSGTQGTYNAYCVHIDNDNGANAALTFTNVDFINEVHQAVGIGLRANYAVTFDQCRFFAEDQAALYCHDWETADSGADKTGQKLIVRNCSLINNSSSKATIMLQSQELVDKGAECVFIGNSVLNKSTGGLISMTLWSGRTLTNDNFLGSSDWVLSSDSALNTLETINNNIVRYTTYTADFSIFSSRVKDVTGGYIKNGQIVYVNVSYTGNATASNTPRILIGFPKPLNGKAALSGIKIQSGTTLDINKIIGAEIVDNTMYVNENETDQKFFVTGTYIAE